MLGPGLRTSELETLDQAGFAPGLVDAVAQEARTLRWLFMMRGGAGAVLAGIGLFAAVLAGAALDLAGPLASLLPALLPVLIGLLVFLPQLEMRAMRRHEPVRWAARRLALLAVRAEPGHDGGGNEQWRALTGWAAVAKGYDMPRSALRALARAMERRDRGHDRNPPLAGDRDGALTLNAFNLEILATVALVLGVCALAMMAVLKFS